MREIRTIVKIIEDDGIFLPVFKYVKVVTEYTKRYHASLERLILLNYMEYYLIEWLAEQPLGDGEVRTDKRTRKKFIDFILRISKGKTLYKDGGVKASLQTLKKTRFLIPFPNNERAICWVNPAFYYRLGNEKRRQALIEQIKKEIGEEDITYMPINKVEEQETQLT